MDYWILKKCCSFVKPVQLVYIIAACNPSGWKSDRRPCVWHSEVCDDYHNKMQLTFDWRFKRLNVESLMFWMAESEGIYYWD